MEKYLKNFEKYMNAPEAFEDYPISRKDTIEVVNEMIRVALVKHEWKTGGALTGLRDLILELPDVTKHS